MGENEMIGCVAVFGIAVVVAVGGVWGHYRHEKTLAADRRQVDEMETFWSTHSIRPVVRRTNEFEVGQHLAALAARQNKCCYQCGHIDTRSGRYCSQCGWGGRLHLGRLPELNR